MFISLGDIPPSSSQSKEFIRDPNIKCNIRLAKGSPGHIRRPAPNGMSPKSLPLTSISDPKNLSGVKLVGFSQMLGSQPMAHTLTNTCEPSGTLKPKRSASEPALRGSNSGTTGCNRKVSLIIACKYGKRFMSHSSIGFPLLIACSSSFLALSKTWGFRSTSAIAHSIVLDVVSVPAANKTCHVTTI
ncbi:hypothetical protein V6N11_009611 [Hibiscus sabdariffa]|uniref:Uncharacterized protein n=1 Tax=Hibiscus sabdariffa TaxID=183260 RepID=A0ABR2P5Y3_9ROSI